MRAILNKKQRRPGLRSRHVPRHILASPFMIHTRGERRLATKGAKDSKIKIENPKTQRARRLRRGIVNDEVGLTQARLGSSRKPAASLVPRPESAPSTGRLVANWRIWNTIHCKSTDTPPGPVFLAPAFVPQLERESRPEGISCGKRLRKSLGASTKLFITCQ
jgi:hypothetical protein